MMLYANVNGEKRRAEKGLKGSCIGCGSDVIAKCGNIMIHHWAHKPGTEDCDSFKDNVGPWHLQWQDLVRKEYCEVVIENHRADIIGNNNKVIEVQSSPISTEDIACREEFYGDMIWVFDATDRFELIPVGKRIFFRFGRTKHISHCKMPIFLDFGSAIVEVESLNDNCIKDVSGFGLCMSQKDFALRYLSDVLVQNPEFRKKTEPVLCWNKSYRYRQTKFQTQWTDPKKGKVTLPEGEFYLPCWNRINGVPESRLIIEQHRDNIANGWSMSEIDEMQKLLAGHIIIIDGLLRIMPSKTNELINILPADQVNKLMPVLEKHIEAGRVPILKDSTKEKIVELSRNSSRLPKDPQRYLFDDI